MSKKALLPSNPLSKFVKILWAIDNSWLIKESLDQKQDWFLEKNLLVEKQLNISLKIILSNVLIQIEIKEIGR